MDKDVTRYTDLIASYATELGVKILAAIVFWIVGRWLSRKAIKRRFE